MPGLRANSHARAVERKAKVGQVNKPFLTREQAEQRRTSGKQQFQVFALQVPDQAVIFSEDRVGEIPFGFLQF